MAITWIWPLQMLALKSSQAVAAVAAEILAP